MGYNLDARFRLALTISHMMTFKSRIQHGKRGGGDGMVAEMLKLVPMLGWYVFLDLQSPYSFSGAGQPSLVEAHDLARDSQIGKR